VVKKQLASKGFYRGCLFIELMIIVMAIYHGLIYKEWIISFTFISYAIGFIIATSLIYLADYIFKLIIKKN